MSLIRVTINDGDDTAVITWSPEYGFIAAGTNRLLSLITYEEIRPEPTVGAREVELGGLRPVPDLDAALELAAQPIPEVATQVCVTCRHTNEHTDTGCTAPNCECYTAVYG